jgi:hypothetical protein
MPSLFRVIDAIRAMRETGELATDCGSIMMQTRSQQSCLSKLNLSIGWRVDGVGSDVGATIMELVLGLEMADDGSTEFEVAGSRQA